MPIPQLFPLTQHKRVNACLNVTRDELSEWAAASSPAEQDAILLMLIQVETMLNEAKKLARRQMLVDAMGRL